MSANALQQHFRFMQYQRLFTHLLSIKNAIEAARRSNEILDALDDASDHPIKPLASAVEHIRQAVNVVFINQIESWCLTGECYDPYGEFLWSVGDVSTAVGSAAAFRMQNPPGQPKPKFVTDEVHAALWRIGVTASHATRADCGKVFVAANARHMHVGRKRRTKLHVSPVVIHHYMVLVFPLNSISPG